MKMQLRGCQRCRGDVYEHVDREGDLAMVCLQCGGVSYIFTHFTAGGTAYSTIPGGVHANDFAASDAADTRIRAAYG